MNTQKTNFMVPLAFVGVMFFAIGFALGINSFLMPVLEKSLQMSSAESNLLLAATFVPFLIFGIPATKCIEHIGYKRTMALSFVLFAAAFGLFIQAAATASIVWFLIASFVAGAANAVLQASVNPYVTILGPLESAAKRISIMGICNKLAWPATTLFITLVIGKGLADIQMEDLYLPFEIIIGIFIILGIIALMAPLPEVKAAGEDPADENEAENQCSYAANKTSIMQFPHLLLGAFALFLYVGVETISLATATGYAKALELEGDNYGFIPSIGMVVGYIAGVILIPKYLSQAAAMKFCAIIALIGSVLVAILPGVWSVYCIFFMALGCSLMWPALWPLAMADLGKFTKAGSSLLTMAIAGGAVMPWVRGVIQDATSFQTSYWICVPCFLFILYYGMAGYKIRTK
ncbi:MFS transporter [Phocaeicola barnesiae]|jgi:FHS family L-fucose permease-like MFS transporter|uniref:MFS transporter n=1 Tax=Phocaeicola barnesiae TaxID=376804 RepID=A0AAW5N8U7_9BACT|nr:MFS transporter [Phocaeicola barnesiae]MBS6469785.1 MFS transporter [Bacteroides sp.]MCR8873744.1 MFS transporter [Phocaeicola barnesiae]MDM8233690.1 MFS transporter [Phocaeicola barnesiae]MDM8242370.1 MFS transporter [Phocaeicola barnesiae]MDM8251536.1 MFS transporter [Phocaeicola barnesiae]